jgi:nitrile hydratase
MAAANVAQQAQTLPTAATNEPARPGEADHTRDPIVRHEPDLAFLKRQLLALIRVLMDKGIFTYPELLDVMHRYEAQTHAPGARVVARAWVDPAFKQRLLANPKAACAELGIEISGYDELEVVENTDRRHYLIVCTTCSCTPAPLTGLTPDWYKSAAYRQRAIPQARAVLREFGLELPADVEVRVIDTNTRRCCLVLPRRPAGTEGLDEEALAALVTQESLFGVGEPRSIPATMI